MLIAIAIMASCANGVQKPTAITSEKPDSTEEQMITLPGKRPLRLLTDRPPNLETPLKYFLYDLTPNNVFFVRWHLAGLPNKIDDDTFRLRIGGNVGRTLSLSMNDLKTKFRP